MIGFGKKGGLIMTAFARVESHFFVNEGWMEDGQLLREVDKIKHLPIAIIQGR